MVNIIQIAVKNKVAHLVEKCDYLVSDNTDYSFKFLFDEEWKAHPVKTARFVYSGSYQEVVFTGDTCQAPLLRDAGCVAVGVYAGDLRTTTPALVTVKGSILHGDPTHDEPPEDIYNQLVEAINQVSEAKVDKVEGKGLSTNDYTNAEKNKLADLENYDDTELRGRIEAIEEKEDGWENKFRYEEMPVAGADNLHEIILYVGETTQTFKKGCHYICILESGVYLWKTVAPAPLYPA